MNNSIIVALITAIAGLLGAAITYYYSRKKEIEARLQTEKLNHYKVLLSALSDLAIDGTNKDDANMRFSLAVNTIALVASQQVITALMEYHSFYKERHNELLKELMLAIRKDIGISKKDDKNTFIFHLIGSK